MHPSTTSTIRALALLAVSAASTACSHAEASERKADESGATVSVTTVQVQERSFPKSLVLTGSLAPNQISNVASDGAGKVVKTFIERGSVVKKGEILARLDARESSLAAAEAGASAESARAQARNAKLECERAERLFEKSVISRAEYDRTKASCETNNANVGAASARAARASKEVGDAAIRAPFSGVVAERFVSAGEYVQPGSKIAQIVEVDPMRVELSVPEIASGKLSDGQLVSFSVAPLPGEQFSARVRFIGPALDGKSRNLAIEALLEKSDPRLKPGMFATTRLPTGTQTGLAIPESAVGGDPASPRAWSVRDGRIEERVLSLGEHDGGMVLVVKGLAAGEQVVARPSAELRDGLRVK